MATVTSVHGKRLGIEVGTNDLVVTGGIKNAGSTPVSMYPKLPSYTVATAPSAATAGAGAIIYVSDGNAGGDTVAVSDGTDWLNLVAGTAIAAS